VNRVHAFCGATITIATTGAPSQRHTKRPHDEEPTVFFLHRLLPEAHTLRLAKMLFAPL
jgi:hypothetical protein